MEEEQKNNLSYAKGERLNTCSATDKDLRTVTEILSRHFEERPDMEAVVFADTNGAREAVTFKNLYENAKAMAKCFLALGVKHSEIIAVSLRTCPEWLYTVFGAMIAGARPMSLSFTYTDGSDVVAMMQKLQTCSAIVLDPGAEEENWNIFSKLVTTYDQKGNVQSDKMPYLRHLICYNRPKETQTVLTLKQMMTWSTTDIDLPSLDPDDIAMMFQTSGSTGFPKAVAHTHRSLLVAVSCLPGDFRCFFKPTGVLYNDRPFGWIGGFPNTLFTGTTRVTRSGICDPPEDPTGFLIDVVKREKCTDIIALPSMLSRLLERQNDVGDDWPVQMISTGGQPMVKQFASGTGKLCKNMTFGYGATEVLLCSNFFINHPDDFEDYAIGKVVPGIEMKIVQLDGNEEIVPVNTRGEIYVKTKFAFKEYYNDPEKTKACFTSDGWFRTDDIGYMNEDGMFFCEGRKSEMILSGGMNVAPSILEATLEKYPGVAHAVCVPVPHDILYQVVCACVILEEGSDVTEEQLRLYCEEIHNDKRRLFTILPTYYMFMDKFPETNSGKTARNELTNRATQLFKA